MHFKSSNLQRLQLNSFSKSFPREKSLHLENHQIQIFRLTKKAHEHKRFFYTANSTKLYKSLKKEFIFTLATTVGSLFWIFLTSSSPEDLELDHRRLEVEDERSRFRFLVLNKLFVLGAQN